MVKMPFGKHKGEDLDDIEESYLLWILDNVETLSPTLRRAIEQSLGIESEPAPSQTPPRPPPQYPRTPPPPVASAVPTGAVGDLKAAVDQCRRKLSLTFHPDRGGNTEAMQKVNEQMDKLIAEIIMISRNRY